MNVVLRLDLDEDVSAIALLISFEPRYGTNYVILKFLAPVRGRMRLCFRDLYSFETVKLAW